MSLSAQKCYGKSITTSDGKNIGVIVNLVINKVNSEASILVFPPLGEELKANRTDQAVRSGVNVGSQILSSAVRYIPGMAAVGDVVAEATSIGTSEADRRAQKRIDQVGKTYYFVPSNTVKQNADDLVLSISFDECADWFRNVTPSPNSECAFFDSTYYQGPARNTPINLNLPSVRGKTIQDSAGAAARIIDVKFDPTKGTVNDIVVLTSKGKKSVALSSTKLDATGISCGVSFDDCPVTE